MLFQIRVDLDEVKAMVSRLVEMYAKEEIEKKEEEVQCK